MFHGAHVLLFTPDAEADRAFARDVLELPSVDAGEGWLIFGLPPAEIAVHPVSPDAGAPTGAAGAELYLMCEDLAATIEELRARGVECSEVKDEGWGLLTSLTLPSGCTLGLYEPRHPTALHL